MELWTKFLLGELSVYEIQNNLHRPKKCSDPKKPSKRKLPKLPARKLKKGEDCEDGVITTQEFEIPPEDHISRKTEILKPTYTWNFVHPIDNYNEDHDETTKIHDFPVEKVIAFTGCPGCGKSELARRYCREYSTQYDTVLWINSCSEDTMRDDFFEIAKEMEVYPPGACESMRPAEGLVTDVCKTLKDKECLIIFDNVQSMVTLEKFLPHTSHTNIKVLTTSTECMESKRIQPFTFNVLSTASACNFVLEQIRDKSFDKQEAVRLVSMVENHPLLLQLCVSYINRHGVSIREYIYSLETYVLTLIHETFKVKYGKLITAAVNLTMQGLLESTSEAHAQFLNMLTFLDVTKLEPGMLKHAPMLKTAVNCDQRVESDFEHIYDGDYSDFWRDGNDRDNEERVNSFLACFEEYSLIIQRRNASNEEETFYTMHESVQEALQKNLKETDIMTCVSNVSKTIKSFTSATKIQFEPSANIWLHHLIPIIRKYSTNEDIMEIMGEHKVELVASLKEEMKDATLKDIVRLFVAHELTAEFKCGQSAMKENNFDCALTTFEDLHRKQSELLGESHLNTLDTLFHIGICLTEKKEYDEAFLKFEQVLEKDQHHQGNIHVKTLDAIHEIGYCHMDSLHYKQALDVFQKALDEEERHLGEKHIGCLNTMYNIGSCLMQLTNIEEALAIFKQLHEKEKQHFGDNHVNSLDTMHLIGHCYMKQTQYKEAFDYFRKVFVQRSNLFGDDHVDTLTAMYNVGSCLMKQEKFEEAITQLEKVMEKRKKHIGVEHADTLLTMFNIGYCLMQINKYEQAIAMFQDVYRIRSRVLGSTHVNTLNTRISIGECLMFQAEYDSALVIFEEVLQKRIETLGEEHISTLDTRHLIGHCYMKQNKYDSALVMLDKVLGMQKKVLGDDHVNTMMTMSTIGRCYMQQSDSDKALSALEDVLAQQRLRHGDNDKRTIATMKDVARFLKDHSNFEEALTMYEKVYEKERKLLGESHADTLQTMNDIGKCLMQQLEQSKCDRALEIFEEIVDKLKEHLGHSHVNTLSAMQSFGLCFLQQSEFKSALEIFEQLVEKQKDIFGENHAKTISTKERIRECKRALGMD